MPYCFKRFLLSVTTSSLFLLVQLLFLSVHCCSHAFAIPTSSSSTTTRSNKAPSSSSQLESVTNPENLIDTCPSNNNIDHNGSILNQATTTTTTSMKFRGVKKVMERPSSHWVGDGFHVYPVFANYAFTKEVSPFLMFDYGPPKTFPPRSANSKPLGVGQHPHRGFETVTIAFKGEVEHQDSVGNKGVIQEGDVQWMTAGRGIIHQEHHSTNFSVSGGEFEMCQLWVNLPKKFKMTKPKYQEITKAQIPVVNLPLDSNDTTDDPDNVIGTARIIAGELNTTKGTASTFSPIQVWDVTIPKTNSIIDLPFQPDHNCIIFVRRGVIEIISGEEDTNSIKISKLNPQDVALMKFDGSNMIRIKSLEGNTSVLILGGEPFDEPIAARGPFVMNTQEELRQAMIDFQNGKMGR